MDKLAGIQTCQFVQMCNCYSDGDNSIFNDGMIRDPSDLTQWCNAPEDTSSSISFNGGISPEDAAEFAETQNRRIADIISIFDRMISAVPVAGTRVGQCNPSMISVPDLILTLFNP